MTHALQFYTLLFAFFWLQTLVSSLNSPTISSFKCGPDNDDTVCPENLCCSSTGFCGSTDAHCLFSKGCQKKFGQCKSQSRLNSPRGVPVASCGIKNYGKRCLPGECCSREGKCGVGGDYCNDGCQYQYGKCNYSNKTLSDNVDTADIVFCGGSYGKCPGNQCCNSEGICGTSDLDCDIGKGCNSEFGSCLPISYQCGPNFGNQKCGVETWCCSIVGYCGQGKEYCEKNRLCESECIDQPTDGVPPVDQPPTDQPTDGVPPEQPPTDQPTEPPVDQPPSEQPPIDPPTDEVPPEQPPTDQPTEPPTDGVPPVDQPPPEQPPTDGIPPQEPPADQPTDGVPPEQPPTDQPTEPPVDQPPSEQPPTDPPTDEVPPEQPPTDQPTDGVPPVDQPPPEQDQPTEPPVDQPPSEQPPTDPPTDGVPPEQPPTDNPTDGQPAPITCGPDTGDSPCPQGTCCSIWGFCGVGDDYCKAPNCRYQCLDAPSEPVEPSPTISSFIESSETVSSSSSTFMDEPITSSSSDIPYQPSNTVSSFSPEPTEFSSSLVPTEPSPSPIESELGSCGPMNGGAVCPSGTCCSVWGFCGISDMHCFKPYCQFQCKDDEPELPTSSSLDIPPPLQTALPGEECGVLGDNAVCPEGFCCSIYGYCGISESHCVTHCAYQCKKDENAVAK